MDDEMYDESFSYMLNKFNNLFQVHGNRFQMPNEEYYEVGNNK